MNLHQECTTCGSCWGCWEQSVETYKQLVEGKQLEIQALTATLEGVKAMARAMAGDLEDLCNPAIRSLIAWQVFDCE